MTGIGTNRATLAPAKRVPCAIDTPIISSGNSGFDRTFYVSPTPNVPSIVGLLNQISGGKTPNLNMSSIPGSGWDYRFANQSSPPDAKTTIAQWDVLHLMHASAAMTTGTTWDQYVGDLTSWCDWAWANGRGGQGCEILLWTAWARLGPNFESDSLNKISIWKSLVDFQNGRLKLGQKPVRVIPGVWLWYSMWQDANAGQEPTAGFFDSLFGHEEDPRFHQTDKGEWVNACMNISCIYGIDPKTIPIGPMYDASKTLRARLTDAERLYVCAKIKTILSNDPHNYFGVDISSWQ